MPIYEYKCDACGKEFEEFQGISDPAVTICRFCKKRGARKQMSLTSFQLKGSGWYATDYGGKTPSEQTGSCEGGSCQAAAGGAEGPSCDASGGSCED